MALYQENPYGGVINTETGASIPDDPDNADWQAYQQWLAEGNTPDPAPPPPIEYSQTTPVNAQVTTTDATVLEVFRFPCAEKHLYRASLVISGIDRGNFTSLVQEGRFVWKRITADALAPGITVVSQIPTTIPTGWATNCVASGTDIVFTVKGPAGRTIDWLLVGNVAVFAPEGLTP